MDMQRERERARERETGGMAGDKKNSVLLSLGSVFLGEGSQRCCWVTDSKDECLCSDSVGKGGSHTGPLFPNDTPQLKYINEIP